MCLLVLKSSTHGFDPVPDGSVPMMMGPPTMLNFNATARVATTSAACICAVPCF